VSLLRLDAVLLAALLGFSSCGPGASTDAGTPGSNFAVGHAAAPRFLERIPDAPSAIAYHGRRRVSSNWIVGNETKILDYVEEVWSDGLGKFLILPGAVSSPAMSAQQAQFFALLQEKRDGFFFRHRDFRVRDVALCLQNYAITDTGTTRRVAGRECTVLELRRNAPSESWYRAAIDPETGLVMSFEELTTSGRTLSRVEFEEFTLNADTSNVAVHGDVYPAAPFDPSVDTMTQLGFQARPARSLPAGYRFVKADSVSENGQTWARLFYGDGVDQAFLLETQLTPAQVQSDTARASKLGTRVLRVFHMGPWTMVECRIGARLFVAVAKVEESALQDMLKSALP